jgi:hypothetical protein
MADKYTTIQGDTWDQIALKVYGSDVATRDIMAENGTRDPRLLAVWRFGYGGVLDVPERTADAATVAQLPPWRREYDEY